MALKKVLLAYDGSSNSEQDVEWGLDFVRHTPIETVIVKVIEFQSESEFAPGAQNSKTILAKIAQAFSDRDVSATTTIITGDPASSLRRYAEKEQVDLIICDGFRSLSPAGRVSGKSAFKEYSLRAVLAG